MSGNDNFSTANAYSSCGSGPHSSSSTTAEQDQLRAQRLASGTSGNDFMSRILTGSTSTYSHEQTMTERIAALSAQIGSTNSNSGSSN